METMLDPETIGKFERVEPFIDKAALNEIISQQRMILEMHQRIVQALASPMMIYKGDSPES